MIQKSKIPLLQQVDPSPVWVQYYVICKYWLNSKHCQTPVFDCFIVMMWDIIVHGKTKIILATENDSSAKVIWFCFHKLNGFMKLKMVSSYQVID